MIVKWRGEGEGVCFAEDASQLADFTAATITEADHKEVLLEGLSADTRYYYSLGDSRNGSDEQAFRTAPVDNGRNPYRAVVTVAVVTIAALAAAGVRPESRAAWFTASPRPMASR